MEILEHMETFGHEQLNVYSDKAAGLRAFIAIHDTTLGPALGGTRIWPHVSEEAAMTDVLRLSRAMTYKQAAAGLDLGGGKGIIIANSTTDKTEALLRAYGRFVETLGGRYVTTEDVGSTPQDMEWIVQETKHVTGLAPSRGGSGDPSEMTGFGVLRGMKACAKEIWGAESLEGKVIAIQGFGKVAGYLSQHLLDEGAKLVVTDINAKALERAEDLEVSIVEDSEMIYDVECDIFSPCALGGTLNGETVTRLRGKAVVGAANNQLLELKDAETLQKRGILYAPDYIVNAGGVINISCEIGQAYDQRTATEKTSRIYETMERVIHASKEEGITTALAANHIAEERIRRLRGIRRILL